jgi:ubiquinone/menaquinone biosynthesis C-methylase UbiE
MAEQQIRFDDGVSYERMMGVWSRLVGDIFIDWLAPRSGLRWIDIGCGNGAFTELLVDRCAPAEIQGIDPSEGQLAFARTRPAARVAVFSRGDAMALPFAEDRFDAVVMALVIQGSRMKSLRKLSPFPGARSRWKRGDLPSVSDGK